MMITGVFTVMKRITRKRVDDLIALVITNAEEINNDYLWPYVIKEIRLFGSCLDSDRENYGDVDLAVHEQCVFAGGSDELFKPMLEFYKTKTPSYMTYIQSMFWPHEETYRRLRTRKHHISLHDINIIKDLGCKSKRIYP